MSNINFIAVFADKSVTTAEKQDKLIDYRSGSGTFFLYFDCNKLLLFY